MMDVTVGDGGQQKSEVVQSGRYLARVERAVQWTHKTTGSHWLIVDLTVKDGHGAKRPVTLWICWSRKDGTKVRAGCQQIGMLGIAAGFPPNAVDETALAGRYVAVTLEYVQDPGQKPKNELQDATSVEWSTDAQGRKVPMLPVQDGQEPAPTAGLPPDRDPMTGGVIDDDIPF